MTPAATGWTEADYYRASRACRRASEARHDQLQIGGVLEDELGLRGESELVLESSGDPDSTPPPGGDGEELSNYPSDERTEP